MYTSSIGEAMAPRIGCMTHTLCFGVRAFGKEGVVRFEYMILSLIRECEHVHIHLPTRKLVFT